VVPLIETARLRLRAFEERDLAPQGESLRDLSVMRHLGGQPLGREDVWRRMLSGLGLWAMYGYGYWVAEAREDGRYLGQVGFADYKRDIEPSIEGEPEMGWIFAPWAQGKGYASEAVAAGLDWIGRTLPGRDVVAIIAPENQPSIRVAEKNGFAREASSLYHGDPILIFRRPGGNR
jgi:RimJ/RimL family protein N-acetyltransferase